MRRTDNVVRGLGSWRKKEKIREGCEEVTDNRVGAHAQGSCACTETDIVVNDAGQAVFGRSKYAL